MTTPSPPPLTPLVVTKADGTQIDHIGLACHDLEDGVRRFQDLTGIEPKTTEQQPTIPYWNAYVRIGDASWLEILGPNPSYKGMNPLKSLLKRFKEPTLWFWYVSTDDFDSLEKAIQTAGRSIERKAEGASNTGMAYVGASIGPGFWPVYPNVIQWKGDFKEDNLKDMAIVPIEEFFVLVGHELDTAKQFFESVGIDGSCLQPSSDDKSYLSLTLKTPDKGSVTFKSEVESLSSFKVLKIFLKDMMGFL
jgi:hypothetical protein